MPDALFVDYGGVLTTPIFDSFTSFCADERIDVETFKRVVLDAARTPDSPFARVETGALTQREFDEAVASLLHDGCGVNVDAVGLKERMFAAIRPDEAMIDA